MRPTFGEVSMEALSNRMLNDPEWAMRYLWYKRTGQPPIPFDEFRPGELAAFLVGIDKILEAPSGLSSKGLSSKSWGPPRTLKQPTRWDEAVETGDPLIDKWEREIAEGRIPDLSEGQRRR